MKERERDRDEHKKKMQKFCIHLYLFHFLFSRNKTKINSQRRKLYFMLRATEKRVIDRVCLCVYFKEEKNKMKKFLT